MEEEREREEEEKEESRGNLTRKNCLTCFSLSECSVNKVSVLR